MHLANHDTRRQERISIQDRWVKDACNGLVAGDWLHARVLVSRIFLERCQWHVDGYLLGLQWPHCRADVCYEAQSRQVFAAFVAGRVHRAAQYHCYGRRDLLRES